MNSKTQTLCKAGDLSMQSDSGSLYRSLLLSAFSRMSKGHLLMEFPDGSSRSFGLETGEGWHGRTQAASATKIPQLAIIRVHNPDFFRRCVLFGDIGFAEAYMAGEWDTPDISAVIAWFILNLDQAPTLSGSGVRLLGANLLKWVNRLSHLLRPNSVTTASRNIREHYDLSNEFFSLWLDPSMMYSSALWTRPDLSLEQAQAEKNEALCRKLRLQASDHVLEIGTGWGSWAIHAARTRGCRVTSLTISPSQRSLALKRIEAAGLSHLIDVKLLDYRLLPADARFDKLVSIEMLEAVGHRYLPAWCETVSRVLKPEGLMALQFITCPDARYEQFRSGVDFIQKHIFPGSLLLSLNRISSLLSAKGAFLLHGLEDLGQDYARTLHTWRQSFNARKTEVAELGFDERFCRKWNYYLAYCEAAFALRNISVVQAVYTRANNLSH